ncbi:MAG: hypothetical protein ACXQTI_01890 [Candidatus Nezhaarchaeales archaeon]
MKPIRVRAIDVERSFNRRISEYVLPVVEGEEAVIRKMSVHDKMSARGWSKVGVNGLLAFNMGRLVAGDALQKMTRKEAITFEIKITNIEWKQLKDPTIYSFDAVVEFYERAL